MPVTMTTKSRAAQFRVGSLGAGWQLLGGREYCFMGTFYRKSTPGGVSRPKELECRLGSGGVGVG